ncbi:MAG: rod-binding protein [Deltaproteobacteria bacterium]|nr:rod-binding protein [Deltaproteobacteria bacterium]
MNLNSGQITPIRIGNNYAKPPVEHSDDQKKLIRLQKACAEVESLFFSSLLKSLKNLIPQDGLLPQSAGMSIYDSMFDQELSSFLSQGQSMGLGKILYRQLLRDQDPNIIKAGHLLPRYENPLPLDRDNDGAKKSSAVETDGRSGKQEPALPLPPQGLNSLLGGSEI